jgi:RNA polymerase primary sigma factor
VAKSAKHAPVSDAVGQYLEEVAGHDLLTAEDEVRLARAIETGRRAQQRMDIEGAGLSPADKARLYRAIDLGDEAKATFIRANLRLVISIAKRYTGRGLDLLDVIQEGNLGLIRAVEKFDWRKGFKFSTYATWWIRQAITRGLGNQGRTIRLPVHMVDVVKTVQETELTLHETYHRRPTVTEISAVSGLEEDTVVVALNAPGETMSLDKPIGEEGDARLGDFVEDDLALDPFVVVAEGARRKELERVLTALAPNERRVIFLRYGLDGHPARTLSAVGDIVGITRERVRQIEARALGKLRHPASGYDLESLL